MFPAHFISALLLLALCAPCFGTDRPRGRPPCHVQVHELDLGGALAEAMASQTGVGKMFTPFSVEEVAALKLEDLYYSHIGGHMVDRQVIALHPEGYPFVIRRQTAKYVELSDLVGRKVYFERYWTLRSWLPGGVPSYRAVAFEQTDLEPESTDFVAPERTFTLPVNLAAFANDLAERQLSGSSSYRAASANQRMAMGRELAAVNLEMLRVLKSGKPLTTDHMGAWNRQVLSAEPTQSPYSQFLDGGVRGTQVEFESDQGRVKVDLRRMETAVGYSTNRNVYVLRPQHVVAAYVQLMTDIAALNHSSSFAAAAGVYRRFLAIHPYHDADGRVGRVLLDYAFMKAGFPPAPLEVGLVRVNLFLSAEEGIANIARAFAGQLPKAPHWSLQPLENHGRP